MEQGAAQVTIEIIKQVGFPAFVALWFMFRTDKKLDELKKEVAKLRRGDD